MNIYRMSNSVDSIDCSTIKYKWMVVMTYQSVVYTVSDNIQDDIYVTIWLYCVWANYLSHKSSQNPVYSFKIHRHVNRAVSGPPLPPTLSLFLLFALCELSCLTIYFPYVSLPSFTVSIHVPSSLTTWVAILFHFKSLLLHFHPMRSLSLLQSDPFTLPSNSLGHPRVLSVFFHLSVAFSLLPPFPSLSALLTCST